MFDATYKCSLQWYVDTWLAEVSERTSNSWQILYVEFRGAFDANFRSYSSPRLSGISFPAECYIVKLDFHPKRKFLWERLDKLK